MSDDRVHEGKVVGRGNGPSFGALDALGALTQLVDVARECFLVHEEESTRRARLHAYETTEVAKVKAAEEILKHYFDQVFAERRAVFEEMFSRLDRALDAGDGAVVHDVLRGIVDVARTSPLADLGNLSQVRKALDDPKQVWEL